MLKLLIPCLIWLSTVSSEAGVHMSDEPLMDTTSDASMLKLKRDSIHQPCRQINSHIPVYTPPSVYVNPHIQQTYLKKELGVHPLAHLHYIQQPAYNAVVPKPGISYPKPVTAAVNYQTAHQSVPYIKPIMPIYQKPMLSYAPTYQKHYAPMHQTPIYNHDLMSKIFYKKYESPQIIHQKPVAHSSVHYTSKIGQVPYVKPLVHASPTYIPTPVHDSIIVKPHCT